MATIVREGTACSHIVAENEPTALFAAEQLQQYIWAISGCKLPIGGRMAAGETSIVIGSVPWCSGETGLAIDGDALKYDGFGIRSFDNGLILTSNRSRGYLYAVYALLELAGCRWFYPGADGEHIPRSGTIAFAPLDVTSNPDFEIRSFTEDTHKHPVDLWKQEMFEVIDWSCKNRLNALFVHKDPLYKLEGLQSVIGELKKRGMMYEFGGHGANLLVDRELFAQKPDLFREEKGVRRTDGNFCASSEEAVGMVVDGVKAVIRDCPEVDLLHLWFDDAMEGSWCDCALCRDIHPSMQQMNVINRTAVEVGKAYPGRKIDMLLYHDTIEVGSIACEPAANLIGFFAPRERCYAHSLGDSGCGRNQYYYRHLKETLAKFKDNTYTFDYYDDLILFRKMKINIPKVISEDLNDYRKLGVSKVSSLMFGRYSWWAYEINMFVFARASWDTGFDYGQALQEWCTALYPSVSAQMTGFYAAVETASYGMLTFCGYQGPISDLRNIPPVELEFYDKHMAGIRQSIEVFERNLALLEGLAPKCDGAEKTRLDAQCAIIRITIGEAKSISNMMRGRYVYKREGDAAGDEMRSRLQTAIDFLQDSKRLIEAVPYVMKGIAGGQSIFVDHLCNDQINFLTRLREDSDNR